MFRLGRGLHRGACGGSYGCGHVNSQTISPAVNSDLAHSSDFNTAFGGANTSTASAAAAFGARDAYAEAYATDNSLYYGSYAETRGDAEAYDLIDGANNGGGVDTATFTLTGWMTPTAQIFGPGSTVYFQFIAYDLTSRAVLDNVIRELDGAFSSPLTVTTSFVSNPGDTLGLDVYLEADAYVSSDTYDSLGDHLRVGSDFKDTLTYTITGAPGAPDVIGQSGHDYTPHAVSGVPEPAAWTMMIAGLGAALRRRREAVPAF